MTDQLISFETAKLAKGKGFNEISDTYVTEGNHYESDEGAFYKNEYGYITAVTQSLLQKWLRERYNMNIVITTAINISGKFEMSIEEIIKSFGTDMTDSIYCKDTEFNTYEEALEAGLQETLKLIK